MPCILTTVHDPIALKATCRRLGLPPPKEQTIQLDAQEVFGWVVHLPDVRFPIVCDTMSGLVAYHPVDNAFHRYGRIMRFIRSYYTIRAKLRQRQVSDSPRTHRHPT